MAFDATEYFKNKATVLVVGNAEIKKEKNLKKYDCIVRLNLGAQEVPIDIWVDNLLFGQHRDLKQYPEVDGILRLNAEKQGVRLKNVPTQILNKCYFWNSTEYEKMRIENRFNIKGHKPTTGFGTIYWFLTHTKCTITVTGFDFFQSPNMYTKLTYGNAKKFNATAHDMELEQKIIREWADRKLLTIN